MRHVLLTRPQWQTSPQTSPQTAPKAAKALPAADSRIIAAPLQFIHDQAVAPALWNEFIAHPNAWLIFTSPTSVEAFSRWLSGNTAPHQAVHTASLNLRIAAVGGGTRDRLRLLLEQGFLAAANIATAVCAGDSERADAVTLLSRLKETGPAGMHGWTDQQAFLVEGQGNRPTLADGLSALGAKVHHLALYTRTDTNWPEHVLSMIRQAAPKEVGVVITSSTVVERAVQMLRNHKVDPEHVVWCTQHQTIAQSLATAGISRVRKIRLEPTQLTYDLFKDEQYW
jgi:uroporphyrinogen-III synthase